MHFQTPQGTWRADHYFHSFGLTINSLPNPSTVQQKYNVRHTCNFKFSVATLKKEKNKGTGEINFNVFHLALYSKYNYFNIVNIKHFSDDYITFPTVFEI